jgi:hypothetical protein
MGNYVAPVIAAGIGTKKYLSNVTLVISFENV